MAVITGVNTTGNIDLVLSSVSDLADPVADMVEILVPSTTTHYFVGVQMFNSSGDLISGASSGTFTVSVKTTNTELFEAPPDPTIDATSPTTLSIAGNIKEMRVVPSSVAGNDITTWRVFVTCNRR